MSVAMSSPPRLCESCIKLGITRADFENPPYVPEGRYHSVVLTGTIGELRTRETQCPLCRLLLHAISCEFRTQPEVLSDWDKEWEVEWMQNTFEYDPATDEAEEQYGSGLHPRLKGAIGSSNYGVQLVDERTTTKLLRARSVPEKVDMARIKSWIKKCRDEHGPGCADTYLATADHPSHIRGFVVIDVVRKCLITLLQEEDYVALSYVWGKTNFPITTRSNFDMFNVDGAFDRVKLAKTIRDAIEITADLGFRFLWVDSICIIQGDEENKMQLIENMDAVYGNAALTIVDVSGVHAGAGILRGRATEHGDLGSPLAIETIAPRFSLGVIPFLDGELMNSPYAHRGWT
jgi:Heterokaryon incompatibility protein (HET)